MKKRNLMFFGIGMASVFAIFYITNNTSSFFRPIVNLSDKMSAVALSSVRSISTAIRTVVQRETVATTRSVTPAPVNDIFLPLNKTLPIVQNTDLTLSGILNIWHTDDFINKKADYHYELITSEGNKVKLNGQKIDESLNGQNVSISGELSGTNLLVKRVSSLEDTVSSKKSNKLSNQPKKFKIATILFNFSNNTNINFASNTVFSASMAREVMYDKNPNNMWSVAGYINEATYGKINLVGKNNIDGNGDVFGWYTLPNTDQNCTSNWQKWVDSSIALAKKDGFDPNGYDSIAFFLPPVANCGWLGISDPHYLNTGTLQNPIWVAIAVSTQDFTNAITHEIGHNLGLQHANYLQCIDSTGNFISGPFVSYSNNCQSREYGDPFSVMGHTWKHFNVFEKIALGILPQSNIKMLYNQSGNYDLYPQETISANKTSAIKIYLDGGQFLEGTYLFSDIFQKNYLTLEYRKDFGIWDYFPSTSPISSATKGVSIRYNRMLVDTNPSSPTVNSVDSPLNIGQSFFEPRTGRTITVTSANTNKATVSISTPTNCVRFDPVVKLNSNYIKSDSKILIDKIMIGNNDSAGCSPATYSVPDTINVDNITNPNTYKVLTLNPGEEKQISTYLQPSSTLTHGNYNIPFLITEIDSGLTSYPRTITYDYQVASCTRKAFTFTVTPNSLKFYDISQQQAVSYLLKNNDDPSCTSSGVTISAIPDSNFSTYPNLSTPTYITPSQSISGQIQVNVNNLSLLPKSITFLGGKFPYPVTVADDGFIQRSVSISKTGFPYVKNINNR